LIPLLLKPSQMHATKPKERKLPRKKKKKVKKLHLTTIINKKTSKE